MDIKLLAPVPVIEKHLGGAEDLLLGSGTVVQVRNGTPVTITRFGADSIPYSGVPEENNVISIRDKLDSTLAQVDSTIISAIEPVMTASAQANALLGLGIGTSYVNTEGHLIMGYNEATVTAIGIDSAGHLQLTY